MPVPQRAAAGGRPGAAAGLRSGTALVMLAAVVLLGAGAVGGALVAGGSGDSGENGEVAAATTAAGPATTRPATPTTSARPTTTTRPRPSTTTSPATPTSTVPTTGATPTVAADPTALVADFAWDPDPAQAGRTIKLVDRSSGDPTRWTWRWDGNVVSSSKPNGVTTAFQRDTDVTLTVCRGAAETDCASVTKTVTVTR